MQEHEDKTILINFLIKIRYLLLAVIDNARLLKYLKHTFTYSQGC